MSETMMQLGLITARQVALALAATLVVYWGYRLLCKVPAGTAEAGELKAQWKDCTLVLSRIGPGIYLVVAGAITLGIVAWNGTSISSIDGDGYHRIIGEVPPSFRDHPPATQQ